MSKTVISDGAYYPSGVFVCQRARVELEAGVKTEISPMRTVCEVAEGVHDRGREARRIAIALNAHAKPTTVEGVST